MKTKKAAGEQGEKCSIASEDNSAIYEALTKDVLRYINAPATDYAIMINGSWGCGKTYYIENVLSKEVLKLKKRILYLSLNGVDNFGELEFQLALELFGGNNHGKIASLIQKGLISRFELNGALDGMLVDTVSSGWIQKIFKRIPRLEKNDYVIVIDDLERTSSACDLCRILGRVYECLIKKGVRVILVCDETNITDEHYHKSKEKFVRRTTEFLPNERGHLQRFIDVRYSGADGLSNEVRLALVELCIRKKLSNLRTVMMIVDGFLDLQKELNDPVFWQRHGAYVLENMFPLFCEYAGGALPRSRGADGVYGLTAVAHIRYYLGEREKEVPEEHRYALEFFKKYDGTLLSRWECVPELVRFVSSGSLDVEGLKTRIETMRSSDVKSSVKAYKRLADYYLMDPQVVANVMDEVVASINNAEYGFGELIQLYYHFCAIREGWYVESWRWADDLEAFFCDAIDRRAESKEFNPAEDELFARTYSLMTLRRSESQVEVVAQKLNKRILSIYEKRKSVVVGVRIDAFLDALQKGDRELANKFAKDPNGECHVFRDISLYDKFADVANLGVLGLRYLIWLVQGNVLQIANAGQYGGDELKPMQELMSFLNKTVCSEVGKDIPEWRKRRIQELIDVLEKGCDHLLKTGARSD